MVADAGDAHNEVRLSVPARPEYLRLARLTASGLASRLGFSYEEVEDLRLALDELCFALVGVDGRPGRLRLCYTTSDTAIEVVAVLEEAGRAVAPSLSQLGRQILAALVDDHALSDGAGVGSSPAPAPAGPAPGPAAPAPGSGADAPGPAGPAPGPSIWLRKARAEHAGR